MRHFMTILYFLLLSLLTINLAYANKADVTNATFTLDKNEMYQFSVTIRHNDQGWNHYANKWEIYDLDNNLLSTRTLFHPHVNEQPFTRNLSNVKISKNIKKVKIKAHDLVHGYGGQEILINL